MGLPNLDQHQKRMDVQLINLSVEMEDALLKVSDAISTTTAETARTRTALCDKVVRLARTEEAARRLREESSAPVLLDSQGTAVSISGVRSAAGLARAKVVAS